VSDCTNFDCEGSDVNEMTNTQLYSIYYGSTCGKGCVSMSRVGGTVNCGEMMGGPAGDHKAMKAAGLFDPEKWKVGEGERKPQSLYDAGVTAKTKTAAMAAGFVCVTSGIVRKSAKSHLSAIQRSSNFRTASMRIRVENFIGIVKMRYQILKTPLAMSDLGLMNRIFYTCFMLHNFGRPIIK
jgi:hypothetical protein